MKSKENNTPKEENHNDVVKPGSNKAEHKKIIKESMNEALNKRRKNAASNYSSLNTYKGSDRAENYEAASQGKSDADEETVALKKQKK